MDRQFTYTKDKLSYLLRQVLAEDVLSAPHYQVESRAEEAFEKRAALEFALWFLDQAIPDDFAMTYVYEGLEQDYGEALAKQIVEGRGWTTAKLAPPDSGAKTVFVDFKKHKK